MQKILIVDDDPHIREVVGFALRKAGYLTVEAWDGQAALTRFCEEAPVLVVLDVIMPEIDGTEVCRELRRKSSVPIVFLTSKDEEIDRILGLELGGDDYVIKPFSPRELVARVRAVLRRFEPRVTGTPDSSPRVLEHEQLRLDLEAFQVTWAGSPIVLTATEFGILRTLLRRPGKVFTRDELMTGAYDDRTVVSDRTIDSHMRRVRAKFANLGVDPVETVHGVGYRLS